jgi:hypothetical protein
MYDGDVGGNERKRSPDVDKVFLTTPDPASARRFQTEARLL